MAHKILKGEISAPATVSVNDAFRISAEIVTASWQRHWGNDHTGRYTHNLIPYVRTKVIFPDRRDIGVSYCRMLIHDTMLKDDIYRTGTLDTHMCERGGKGNETVEQFYGNLPKSGPKFLYSSHDTHEVVYYLHCLLTCLTHGND